MNRDVNRKGSLKGLMPILFALIYGVSPIDLIPDVLPLIGLVDDAILVPVLLLMGLAQLRKSRRSAATQGTIIHPPMKR